MLKSMPAAIVCLLGCVGMLLPGAHAQTATVTYDLQDVWLKPDITHPRAAAQQMTGTFVWTYPMGNFGNGSGQFTSLNIPWWGSRTFPTLKSKIEPKAIEITMVGNYHGLGLDLTLRLSPPLAPDQASPIDTVRSQFDIEVGVSRRGHVTRGRIVPRCPKPQSYGSATPGSGQFVPTITTAGGDPRIGNGSFRIDCDRLLGGASCFFVLGPDQAQFPFIGVTVLVDPRTWLLFPLQAGGSSGVPGAGSLRIPLPIPNDPKLVGAESLFQAVALDQGAPGGVFAATAGLKVIVCR